MKRLLLFTACLSAISLMLSGCMAGKNTSLGHTRSIVGFNFDTTPPAMDASVARREGVVQPVFAGGVTPPFIAGFKSEHTGIERFVFGVDSIFAGGRAAVIAAAHEGGTGERESLTNYIGEWVLEKPNPKGGWRGKYPLVEGTNSHRFALATDTALGLSVKWEGAQALQGIPSSVRFGFNRKEMAWAPVGVVTNTTEYMGHVGGYNVNTPSFIARLEHGSAVSQKGAGTKLRHRQFIAVGAAADQMAKSTNFSALVLNAYSGVEDAKKETSQSETSSKLRAAVLETPPKPGVKESIQKWINQNGKSYSVDLFLSDSALETDRQEYLKAHPLN